MFSFFIRFYILNRQCAGYRLSLEDSKSRPEIVNVTAQSEVKQCICHDYFLEDNRI